VFPNEKREFSAGCTEDRRAGRRATVKGGAGCRKEQAALALPFPQPSLLCSPPARLSVQPTGPSCSAACRPALLCGKQPAENSSFSFGNTALQPARPFV